MGRIARVVVPGVPHHVTQRGGRRQRTFFSQDDYRAYLALLREWALRSGVDIWAYCLMPNHVHLVVVPQTASSLSTCMSQVHGRYARHINGREEWRGHLWQERFFSVPMDDRHTYAAARYVMLNPVRAGLVQTPADWRYSSLHAHLHGADEGIIAPDAFRGLLIDWPNLLSGNEDTEATELLRVHTRTGRPAGDEPFIARMESATGLKFASRARGRPKKK